jgi:hypothetical protein
MSHDQWTRKNIVRVAAIIAVGCVMAVLAIGLAYPEPVQQAALGPDWQCSRIALVWTTCSRVQQAASSSVRVNKRSACPRTRA